MHLEHRRGRSRGYRHARRKVCRRCGDPESASAVGSATLRFGVTPIARIASHDAHAMELHSDSGGMGLMLAHIEAATEADGVVRQSKSPPRGTRSTTGTIATLALESPPPAINRIPEVQVMLAAEVKAPTGMANAE